MKNFFDLLHIYKGHGKAVMIGIIGTILCSLNELIYPYITKYILNDVLAMQIDEAFTALFYVALVFLGSHIVYMIGFYISMVKNSMMVDEIRAELRNKLFWKLEHLSFKWYDNNRTGEIMAILGSDIDQVDWMSWSLISEFLGILISLVGTIIIFGSMNFKLTVMILPMIPLILMVEKVYVKYMKPKSKLTKDLHRDQLKFEEDKIAGIRTVQSFNKEGQEFSAFIKMNARLNDASKIKWQMHWAHNVANSSVTTFFFCFVIIGGSAMVLNKDISLSDLLVFNMYSYMLINPAKAISHYMKEFVESIVSYNKVMSLLNTPEDILNCESPIKPSIKGQIQFNNVSFSYNGNNTILKDCNLKIDSGEYVAIVGPSGAGKSTIAGLIPRYYDLISGSITIDGINIKDIDLGFLRKCIGVVQQDIYLFAGSIFDNIAYSANNAKMEDVIRAANLANCHEFISKLPNGYNTDIGERGVKLSGGQKQRIVIARLFLSNPPILIFDEATSALDNESEKVVQKALEKLAKDRTTIVIAHRLSTIQNADRILFLSDNGIEEEGTHEDLMKLGGKYAKLYKSNIIE